MGTFKVKGLAELEHKLGALSAASRDLVIGPALYDGVEIVADAVRENLSRNLEDQTYAGRREGVLKKSKYSHSTGDLLKSLGVTPMQTDKRGVTNRKIGFDGYDRKGVPNQLKARVMESGTSRLRPRPFMKPAVEKTRKAAQRAMVRRADEEIEKIMK